jgi:hypothetical protein
MLFSQLRAVSRARVPVYRHGRGIVLPTARYLSISCARTADTVKSGSAELDLLLSLNDKVKGYDSVVEIVPTAETTVISEQVLATPPSSEIFSEGASSAFSPEFVEFSNLVEPSFTSLGLAHYWPSGWMQAVLECVHIDVGLPWWQAIGVTTICLRFVVFPITLIAQRNMARLNEHQPTIQKLQVQAQMAQVRGDIDGSVFAQKKSEQLYDGKQLPPCHESASYGLSRSLLCLHVLWSPWHDFCSCAIPDLRWHPLVP